MGQGISPNPSVLVTGQATLGTAAPPGKTNMYMIK